MDKMREKGEPRQDFRILDVVYHLEHHSYEQGERWLVTECYMDYDMPLYMLMGISDTNLGVIRSEYGYDLTIHEDQIGEEEKSLFRLLFL